MIWGSVRVVSWFQRLTLFWGARGHLKTGGRGRKLEIGLSLCCLAPLKVQWTSNLKWTESKDIVWIYYQQWRRAGTSYLFITPIVSHLILSVVGKMYVIFMSSAKGGVFGGDYFKRRFDAAIFLVMTAEWYMEICHEVHPRKKTTGISPALSLFILSATAMLEKHSTIFSVIASFIIYYTLNKWQHIAFKIFSFKAFKRCVFIAKRNGTSSLDVLSRSYCHYLF